MLRDCLGELRGIIKTYNAKLATSSTTTAIKGVTPPSEISRVMTIAIRDVGDRFGMDVGRTGIKSAYKKCA